MQSTRKLKADIHFSDSGGTEHVVFRRLSGIKAAKQAGGGSKSQDHAVDITLYRWPSNISMPSIYLLVNIEAFTEQ
jgi:hypothetical protein